MHVRPTVSCIIPFFNEKERIESVLSVVSQVEEIDEIICVDDGSTDHGAEHLPFISSKIRVLTLSTNTGKSQAVYVGVQKAHGEILLLMDADLTGLVVHELSEALSLYSERILDLLILRRFSAPWFVRITRADVLLSGQRILKKSDLLSVFARNPHGYQLEMKINDFFFSKKKTVAWMYHHASNTYRKGALFSDILHNVVVNSSVISSISWAKAVWIFLWFGQTEVV